MKDDAEREEILESMAYHWSAADDMVISEFRGERQQSMTNATDAEALITSCCHARPGPHQHRDDEVTQPHFQTLNRHIRRISNLILHVSPPLEYLTYMKLASTANFGALHQELTSSECRYCGDFGNFMFIPTLSRCCFNCIDYSPQLVVIDAAIAGRFFSVSEEVIAEIPRIPTIGSGWDFDLTNQHRSKTVVSYQQTRDHVIYLWKHHPEKVPGCMIRGANFDDYRFAMPAGLPSQDESLRFLVCIPFPYLNTRTHAVERGLCCRGCEQKAYKISFFFQHPMDLDEESAEELEIAVQRQNKAFTQEGFLRHFEECGDAKELWKEYTKMGKDIFDSVKYRIPMFPWRE
ncbi:hypothetical protein B0J14DRAFT_683926 [Halenospora varia]|nr:hypothetical protein B0J14DRAFT_683926 [Halenospora varia]